jgi:hypothetical protein
MGIIIQIEKQLVISTFHITYQDSVNLLDVMHDAPVYDLYPYGWLIYVSKDKFYRTLSPAFQKIWELAIENECQWIKLGPDGPIYNELPAFEW